jgi:hypothetical protein
VGAGCRQYEEFGGSLCDGGSGDPADVGSQSDVCPPANCSV